MNLKVCDICGQDPRKAPESAVLHPDLPTGGDVQTVSVNDGKIDLCSSCRQRSLATVIDWVKTKGPQFQLAAAMERLREDKKGQPWPRPAIPAQGAIVGDTVPITETTPSQPLRLVNPWIDPQGAFEQQHPEFQFSHPA